MKKCVPIMLVWTTCSFVFPLLDSIYILLTMFEIQISTMQFEICTDYEKLQWNFSNTFHFVPSRDEGFWTESIG